MIQYLLPPDYSSVCRNRVLQSSRWLPKVKLLYSASGALSPIVDDQAVYLSDNGLDGYGVSVSGLEYQSEYDSAARVYSHKLSFVLYNTDYEFLQSFQGFHTDHMFMVVLEDNMGEWVFGLEGAEVSASTIMRSEGEQSISITLSARSSYNILPITIVPYTPPEPYRTYLHITGVLDKSRLSGKGGFMFNDTAYYFDAIDVEYDGYFDIAIEEPVTMHNFSAEWPYIDQSPLLSIDLSDFTGHNDVDGLEAAFKGNANLESVELPDMPEITTFEECFSGCASLSSVGIQSDLGNVVSFSKMFRECASLPRFSFGTVNIDTNPDCSQMFLDCDSLEEVDFTKLRTVGNLDYMFSGCLSLMNVVLTSKVWAPTSANHMFDGCVSLNALYLWGMDTTLAAPGDFDSASFFPSIPGGLTVDFMPTHAHGYDIRGLKLASVDSYIRTLAQIGSSFAGEHNQVVMTSAQYSYIAEEPSRLAAYVAARDTQGWAFSFA